MWSSQVIVVSLLILSECKFVENNGLESFHSNTDEDDIFEPNVEKRSILGGVSILLTVVNLGMDVFFGNGGCCIVHASKYPDACQKVKNIKSIRDSLRMKGYYIERKQLESTKAYNWLMGIETNNKIIMTEIVRIKTNVENLIAAIDPEAKKLYAAKAREIEQLAKNQIKTVRRWTMYQLDLKYKPLYETLLGKVRLLGFIGRFGGPYAVREFQITQINAGLKPNVRKLMMLNAASKVGNRRSLFKGSRLGDNLRLKSMVLHSIRNKKRLAFKKTNMGKAFKATRLGFRFIGIGFELYSMGKKIKQCSEIMKQVVAKEIAIKEDENNVNIFISMLDTNLKQLKESYRAVKNQLSSKSFIALIQGMRTLIIESARSSQDKEAQKAIKDLEVFLKFIDSSNPSLTNTLQKKLIAGLASIHFKYACLATKYEMIRHISNECMVGAANLTTLYENAAKVAKLKQKCKNKANVTYTSFGDVKRVIDTIESKKQNYYSNCLLNSAIIMVNICNKYKCLGESAETAATADISVDEIKVVCLRHKCVIVPLTSAEKKRICVLKKSLKPPVTAESVIVLFPKNKDKVEIKKEFNKCP